MNMRHNESKELLPGPDGKPLIEFSLQAAYQAEAAPLVIARADKRDLLKYCDDRGVETLTIEPQGGEWPHTIIASSFLWRDYNVLMLPDTRFEPVRAVDFMFKELNRGYSYVFGIHEVSDSGNWGIVGNDYVIEKPSKDRHGNNAWGLIGFRGFKSSVTFFQGLADRDRRVPFEKGSTVNLRSFVDVTRG